MDTLQFLTLGRVWLCFDVKLTYPQKGKKINETMLVSRSGFTSGVRALSTVTDLINARGVYLIFLGSSGGV